MNRQSVWFRNLLLFALILVVLKFLFGWRISIVGSLVLTLIVSVIFGVVSRVNR